MAETIIMTIIAIADIILFAFWVVRTILERYRYELFQYKIHLLDCDECKGENMQYDAVILHSELDGQSLKNIILTRLDPPHKICDSDNPSHFERGRRETANIADAITVSKRTIIVLTKKFCSQIHCKNAFRTAWAHWHSKNRESRLIIIKDVFVETSDIDDNDILDYLQKYTYLEMDTNMWQRLEYVMPQNSIKHENTDQMLNG